MNIRVKTLLTPLLAVFAIAGQALADDVPVTQKDKTFLPHEITVKAGDTIVFRNEDTFTHNMFSRSKDFEFNLKMQKPGEDLKQTFAEPGTAIVRCAIHPKMKLIVNVEK